MTPVYIYRRPAGRNNFPLVDFFFHTGESMNPFRCGSCVTKKQREAALKTSSDNKPPAACCRKCGMDFYR